MALCAIRWDLSSNHVEVIPKSSFRPIKQDVVPHAHILIAEAKQLNEKVCSCTGMFRTQKYILFRLPLP